MLDGYDLPVSRFTKDNLLDGSMRNNVAFQEKRSIADRVPVWHKENCIQCNQCAFVCPHATIRPFLINEAEMAKMPEYAKDDVLDAMGGPQAKGLKFRIQVSPRNCVGCGLCVTECPGKPVKQADGTIVKQKALVMEEAKSQFFNEEGADYLYKNIEYKTGGAPVTSVKGAAFLMPYQEVSGACAGCGETPYYRLATQLFGKDMLIANTTGCSSIYNSSTPLSPFCTDKNGEGVAWANSLFEDNAEFGYGMRIATNYKLAEICRIFDENKDAVEPELKSLIEDYEANIKNREHVREIKDKLIELVEKSACEGVKEVLKLKGDLLDQSVWIIGGDGWSYDIGYGGLDHVIANEEDVNILVLDTEVYSNTGGQSSKSSQTGSIAKFTASGKKTAKKFLALIAMTYGHVYVAQVAMGGNKLQAIKALKEAESYNGPSLIICYAPCVNHGIKGGMANAQLTEKKAVECGYFPIFRYDPRLKAEGKDPLTIDCPTPDWSKFRDFLLCETRYSQLPKVNPEHCEELLTKCEKYAQDRWNKLQKFHEVVEEK
jgi:pyruvate-ferredoxin/flavodoxin oxidoreductase